MIQYILTYSILLMIPVGFGLVKAFKWACKELPEDQPTKAEELDRLLGVEFEDWYK